MVGFGTVEIREFTALHRSRCRLRCEGDVTMSGGKEP